MGLFSQCLRHPQQLRIRRINFQIHLWAGLILALYVTLIGVTGSILVFSVELGKLFDPSPWPGITSLEPAADPAVVIGKLSVSYPGLRIVSVMGPTPTEPVFIAILQGREPITVACHPVTGQVLGEVHGGSRLDWIYNLHENLLAGRIGRVANGICAASLLLLVLTGLVNWWPGVQNWRRALRVDFRRTWTRINFDLHSAVGFWSLTFLVIWASSGVYFAWPGKVQALINRLSPTVNSRPPMVMVNPNGEMGKLDFHSILTQAYVTAPGTKWKGVVFPASPRSPLEILMSRSPGIGRDYEDVIYFNPYDGRYISTWQYGVNISVGDWIIWLQIPLHFGTHWGLGVKCLWAAMGLALPLLAATGLAMYWNRVLAKKWRQL